MNEGDLGLPRGRHCYEGDWSKMREGLQLCILLDKKRKHTPNYSIGNKEKIEVVNWG